MIREFVKKLAERGQEITIEEWDSTPLNSYERQYLYEFLNTEVLLEICVYINSQASHVQHPITYNDSIVSILFPELLMRIRDIIDTNNKIIEKITLG